MPCAGVRQRGSAQLRAAYKNAVWIFHGELDRGMGFSVIQAHEMINRCGGSSKLTLLSGQGHEILLDIPQ